MAASRWGVFRTLSTALRTATRPGSPGLSDRLASIPRLWRATVRGDYSGTTKSKLFLLAAAVVYVVSPLDLVPEAFFTIFGLGDDAMVISWIAATFINETESFLAWEREREGGRRGDGRRGDGPPRGETVPGHVVP